jgi:hypothetical protein
VALEFRPSNFQKNSIAIQYQRNITSLSSIQSIPNVIAHIIPHIAFHSRAIQAPLSKHSIPIINHSNNNNNNEKTSNEQQEINPTLKNTLTNNNININKEQH